MRFFVVCGPETRPYIAAEVAEHPDPNWQSNAAENIDLRAKVLTEEKLRATSVGRLALKRWREGDDTDLERDVALEMLEATADDLPLRRLEKLDPPEVADWLAKHVSVFEAADKVRLLYTARGIPIPPEVWKLIERMPPQVRKDLGFPLERPRSLSVVKPEE